MKIKKKSRLIAPVSGNFFIFTKGNLKISDGYQKIHLYRNPLLEISEKQITIDNLLIPFHQKWREQSSKSSYIEYRTKDYCNVKIIFSKKERNFYVSIYEVTSIAFPMLIETRRKL